MKKHFLLGERLKYFKITKLDKKLGRDMKLKGKYGVRGKAIQSLEFVKVILTLFHLKDAKNF